MKLFKKRERVHDPIVIITSGYSAAGTPNPIPIIKVGLHYRVIPSSGKEVRALQMAEHQLDKYAPANGDGVIVTPKFLANLDA